MRNHGHGEAPQDPRDRDTDYLKTLGYERRDVAIPTLAKWITGLFVFIFGALGLAWGVYALFVTDQAQDENSLPMTAMQRDVPRDLPKVQAYPRRDMVLFRREEEQKVNGYGWVDQRKGVAHVPVEKAIEEIAAGGFTGLTGRATPPPSGMNAGRPAPPATAPPGPAPAAPSGAAPGPGQSHGSEFNR